MKFMCRPGTSYVIILEIIARIIIIIRLSTSIGIDWCCLSKK
jgi:hypothetical protein